MEMLKKCCLNPWVIAGMATIGLGVWIAAPDMLLAVLPLLILAVCPLSMLLMMKMMNKQAHAADTHITKTKSSDDLMHQDGKAS